MSWLPVKECVLDAPNPAETVLLLEHLESSPVNVSQIRNRTRRDPLLSRVYRFVMEGWTAQVDQDLLPFSKRKEELSTLDGCLLWGKRVIVPPSLRRSILCELHKGHPRTSRMKCLARMFVRWPGLDLDIERTVASCSLCQSHRAAVPTVPLQPWTWPTQPWTRIHMDLAGPFLNQMFLVLIDLYSKWIEVLPLTSTTSTALIQKIRPLFAQFGLPTTVVTDNGTQFVSEELEQFLKNNGIRHILSAPYHPATNGLAERAVQIFKAGLRKITDGSTADCIARILLNYRRTPQTTTGSSPAELMFGRNLRT